MDKIVALCKRRGLIFAASEIYAGIANTYDYDHYGVLLKNNVIGAWWKAMIQDRADHLQEARDGSAEHPDVRCGRAPSKLPGDHPDCELTDAREFNLMFETSIGPLKDAGSTVYLRPETAQGIFLAFKTTLQYARKKPPFGIAP